MPVICRYCNEQFVPQTGKPGFIDECPDCLYAKTAPQISEEQKILAQLVGPSEKAKKAMRALRRTFIKTLKMDEAQADAAIIEVLEAGKKFKLDKSRT